MAEDPLMLAAVRSSPPASGLSGTGEGVWVVQGDEAGWVSLCLMMIGAEWGPIGWWQVLTGLYCMTYIKQPVLSSASGGCR